MDDGSDGVIASAVQDQAPTTAETVRKVNKVSPGTDAIPAGIADIATGPTASVDAVQL